MDIVIIANFCMNFSEDDSGRYDYLASHLCKEHNVELITSSFCHYTKIQRDAPPKKPYKVTFLRVPAYEKNICFGRLRSHAIFGRKLEAYLKQRKKPDVVYCAVPSLSGPVAAARYCNQNNIRFVVDIQDLWPEAFQMALPVPVLPELLFLPLRIIEDEIYRRADDIVAVSQTYVDRAVRVSKKCSSGHAVFIGTRLAAFDRNAQKEPLFRKKPGEIWLAYCGTLGKSYDIRGVIDALAICGDPRIHFIVMGSGPRLSEFEQYAAEKKINARFTGYLPYDDMCALLSQCDITVNPIIGTSVSSIITKHADYTAVGLPIINTQNSPEFRRMLDEYQMGVNCENENPKALAAEIMRFCSDPALREACGKAARRCAEERFDRAFTYQEIMRAITNQTE